MNLREAAGQLCRNAEQMADHRSMRIRRADLDRLQEALMLSGGRDEAALESALAAAEAREARLREVLVDLGGYGYLDCIVIPPCGDCRVCRARAALSETEARK